MSTDSKPNTERECLDTEKKAEWRAGFRAMANDPESMYIEYAFPAQAEVVLGNGESSTSE